MTNEKPLTNAERQRRYMSRLNRAAELLGFKISWKVLGMWLVSGKLTGRDIVEAIERKEKEGKND